MSTFNFHYPLQVRYGDLDAQWHVNNASFLVFLEQARFSYLVALHLFNGVDFFDVGLIVADAHIAYVAPIDLLQKIRVDVRVSRIGNKSLTFEYQIVEEGTEKLLCTPRPSWWHMITAGTRANRCPLTGAERSPNSRVCNSRTGVMS